MQSRAVDGVIGDGGAEAIRQAPLAALVEAWAEDAYAHTTMLRVHQERQLEVDYGTRQAAQRCNVALTALCLPVCALHAFSALLLLLQQLADRRFHAGTLSPTGTPAHRLRKLHVSTQSP